MQCAAVQLAACVCRATRHMPSAVCACACCALCQLLNPPPACLPALRRRSRAAVVKRTCILRAPAPTPAPAVVRDQLEGLQKVYGQYLENIIPVGDQQLT